MSTLPSGANLSSVSRRRDIDLAQAARPAARQECSSTVSREACTEPSRLVVRAVATNGRSNKNTKKAKGHVDHHCDEYEKPVLPDELELKWLETNNELKGLKMEELATGGQGSLLGSRIPKHYFLVRGFGEADSVDGAVPWETGSYDLALEDAGEVLDYHLFKILSPHTNNSSWQKHCAAPGMQLHVLKYTFLKSYSAYIVMVDCCNLL